MTMHPRIADRLIQVAQEARTQVNETQPFTDWSTLLSSALKELHHAEDELRLLHTNLSHLRRANEYLLRAQMRLIDLSEWIITESQK